MFGWVKCMGEMDGCSLGPNPVLTFSDVLFFFCLFLFCLVKHSSKIFVMDCSALY